MDNKVVFNGPTPADVLLCQLHRIITNLFKHHLVELQTLAAQHDEALDKLAKTLPSEYAKYVELADYLTPEAGDRLRKRTLDTGNDAWREAQQFVAQFDISFKTTSKD